MITAAASDHGFTGLTGWAADLLLSVGDIGIGLLVLVEVVVPPIPSEAILPFAGYLTQSGSLSLVGLIVYSTIGAWLGGLVYYGVGRALGMERAVRLVAATRLITRDDLDRGVTWFERHGRPSVFFGRMIPGVRSVISIPAGASRMNLVTFSVLTMLGSGLWNGMLIGVGAALGSEHERLEKYLGYVDLVVYAALALAVGVLVWRRVREARSARSTAQPSVYTSSEGPS
ncbi:DedA family protein [Sanguibacter inulinus]|uniref:DedA family protein n=1 Tax=Sanguibacter inulinus TaxID=60922 RepID=A0A853EX75_9MICO|nr:DedA family protein [Sanguibacter inulinus]MBF0723865.1 DedA family protein [Sanguibacter inulinus]NYS95010.1 DedA family protein [Sanguibacter inulinus]